MSVSVRNPAVVPGHVSLLHPSAPKELTILLSVLSTELDSVNGQVEDILEIKRHCMIFAAARKNI